MENSKEIIDRLKKKYPLFTFISKSENQKGQEF